MLDFRRKFSLIKRQLVPPEEIAGIEITEKFGRLLLLDSETLGVVTAVEVSLPEGSIADGRVVSLANVTQMFKQLKSAAGPEFNHNPSFVLALPPNLFFTHVLSLPDIPEENFEEAARLNAAQISPIKISEAYFDWQNLGVNLETFERELFIAVAYRAAIDPYLEAARQADMNVVATEPWSLGLVRAYMYFASATDKRAVFLINRASSDGMDFVITKDGKPLFSHFFFWKDVPEVEGGKVSLNALRAVARRGIAKVASFFATRYKDPLTNALLFVPLLQRELAEVFHNEFKMNVAAYRLPSFRGAVLPETWVGALGAALRGIIPRGEDTVVSLMPVGTEELFRSRQTDSYVKFWGKALAVAMGFFLLMFTLLWALASHLYQNFSETLAVKQRSEAGAAAAEFSQRAREFNALVLKAREAEARESLFIEEFRAVIGAANQDINILQFSIFGDARQIRLVAFATDRGKAIGFRSRIEATGEFQNVDMPLALFRDVAGGVEFSITADLL